MEKISLEAIHSMEGHKFEDLVESLLFKMGYKVEGRKQSADGGIDIIAYNYEPLVGGKYIIQCKRYASSVSESVVRDLYGVVTDQKANKGIVVTNSDFSSAAIKFSEGKPLELINGEKLIVLLSRYYSVEDVVKERRLTRNQEWLLTSMADEISKLREEYESITSGAVFRQGPIYKTDRGFAEFSLGKYNELRKFFSAWEILFNDFEIKLKDSNFNDNKQIKLFHKQNKESLRGFLGNFRSFYFVQYPKKCKPIYDSMCALYKVLFEILFYWADLFTDIIQSPETHFTADGVINVSSDLLLPYTERIKQSVKGVKQTLQQIGGPCFIATACYGSDSAEVTILREFRDKVLGNSPMGRASVQLYYKISPPLAHIIEGNRFLKDAARFFISPFVHIVKGYLVGKKAS